jgi:hypothetical protein
MCRRIGNAVQQHAGCCFSFLSEEETRRCENIAAVATGVGELAGRAALCGQGRIVGGQAALGHSSSEFEPLVMRLLCPPCIDVKSFYEWVQG